jgi:hypothetical protein
VVRRLIADSWRRSRGAGVRPEGHVPPRVHGADDLHELREEHPLARMMPTLRHLLLDVAEAAGHLVAVSSAEGELLWVEGPARMRRAAEDAMNFAEGTLWSEAGAGTNALGTALAVGHPIQVFAAEHFSSAAHSWICSAAPISDPESGRLLGTVDLTGHYRTAHPHSLALATAAAGAATGALRQELGRQDDRLRDRYLRRLMHLGQRPTGVVSRTGRVVMANPAGWLGAHVPVPGPDGAGVLPGGARIHAEGIGVEGGYLVWAADGGEPEPPVPELRLRLMGAPRAWLGGHALRISPRHGEVLALLAMEPDGLSADQLGAELYGPRYAPTSVRSEVSRLRRLLGDALATRPYRLRADVCADLLEVRALARAGRREEARRMRGPGLLPGSTAPGVVRMRAELDAVVAARDGPATPLQRLTQTPAPGFDRDSPPRGASA